jgi:hypothetical protein
LLGASPQTPVAVSRAQTNKDAAPVVIAVAMIPEFAEASLKDFRELHLSPAGDTIILVALDIHISVEGLIRDLQHISSGRM